MAGIIKILYDLYIQFMVWLGAGPSGGDMSISCRRRTKPQLHWPPPESQEEQPAEASTPSVETETDVLEPGAFCRTLC